MTVGNVRTLTTFPTGNPAFDRYQQHVKQQLGPVLSQVALADTDYLPLTFATSWANVGIGEATGAFRKTPVGVVHVKGLFDYAGAGGQGTTIATLPEGYRPKETQQFIVANYTGAADQTGRIDVHEDGTIVAAVFSQTGAGAGHLSCNLSFMAEQ